MARLPAAASATASGWIVDDEAARRRAPARCRPQLHRARAAPRALSAVIPRRYRGVSFDRPPVTEMTAAVGRASCARYVRNARRATSTQGRGLWFIGDVGTGKTTLAMLVSKAALEARAHASRSTRCRGCSPRSARRSTSDPGGAPTRRSSTGSTEVDLLHLDDLGAEKTSPMGARAALRDRQRALRGTSARSSSRPTSSARELERADRRAHRLAARARCATWCPLYGRDRGASRSSTPPQAADRPSRPPRTSRGPERPYTHTVMPGIVIVGAQWGDEGKGKVTDLLAEQADRRRPLPGRQQRRPHDRPRRRGVQVPPDPLGDPLPGQDLRDRQRRRDRPDGADRRDRRAAGAAASTSAACGSRANAHLIMPYHLLLDHGGRGEARQARRSARPGAASAPATPTRRRASGIRVQDLLDEKILSKKIMAALEPKRLMLRPFAKDPALDLHAMTEEYLTYGHRLEQHIADTARAAAGTRSTTAARSSSRAPRARCSTSTTAPIRSSPRRTRSRARPASAPASGRSDIDEVWGVAKAYATRVGAGPVPDRARRRRSASRCASAAASSARPPAGRAARGWLDLVALRYAARLNGMTAPRRSPSSTCSPASTRSGSARATAAPRAPSSTTSPTTSRCSTTRRPSTTSCPGWNEDITALPHARTTCRESRARLPRLHRGVRRRADRAASASAPAATRSSSPASAAAAAAAGLAKGLSN